MSRRVNLTCYTEKVYSEDVACRTEEITQWIPFSTLHGTPIARLQIWSLGIVVPSAMSAVSTRPAPQVCPIASTVQVCLHVDVHLVANSADIGVSWSRYRSVVEHHGHGLWVVERLLGSLSVALVLV